MHDLISHHVVEPSGDAIAPTTSDPTSIVHNRNSLQGHASHHHHHHSTIASSTSNGCDGHATAHPGIPSHQVVHNPLETRLGHACMYIVSACMCMHESQAHFENIVTCRRSSEEVKASAINGSSDLSLCMHAQVNMIVA